MLALEPLIAGRQAHFLRDDFAEQALDAGHDMTMASLGLWDCCREAEAGKRSERATNTSVTTQKHSKELGTAATYVGLGVKCAATHASGAPQ